MLNKAIKPTLMRSVTGFAGTILAEAFFLITDESAFDKEDNHA
jgi:hypothetical protein